MTLYGLVANITSFATDDSPIDSINPLTNDSTSTLFYVRPNSPLGYPFNETTQHNFSDWCPPNVTIHPPPPPPPPSTTPIPPLPPWIGWENPCDCEQCLPTHTCEEKKCDCEGLFYFYSTPFRTPTILPVGEYAVCWRQGLNISQDNFTHSWEWGNERQVGTEKFIGKGTSDSYTESPDFEKWSWGSD